LAFFKLGTARKKFAIFELVFVHVVERRRICMDADRRCDRSVTNVVGVFGPEGEWLIRSDDSRCLTGTVLFENSSCYDESTDRSAVIVKTSGLTRHPTDH